MIDTFFFPLGAHRLFAAFHPPAAAAPRNCGVLLCAPLGHEYVQSYFACRTLASALAARGFPVLRFDYRGCGNSSGDLTDAALSTWQEDLAQAVAELRCRARIDTICVGGLRFGAMLGALAVDADPAIRSVLLWEPVLSGDCYLDQLRAANAAFLRRLGLGAAVDDGDTVALLGFALSRGLLRDLAAIQIERVVHAAQDRHVLLIEGAEDVSGEAARQRIAVSSASFAHVHDPDAEAWRTDPHHVFLPGKAVREIVTWMDMLH